MPSLFYDGPSFTLIELKKDSFTRHAVKKMFIFYHMISATIIHAIFMLVFRSSNNPRYANLMIIIIRTLFINLLSFSLIQNNF